MITSGRDIFQNKDGEIIFTGKYMEVYISEYYFEKGASEIVGEHFRTLGILNFRSFADVDGNKPSKLKVFNIPAEIYTYPSGGYEERSIDLVGKGEEKYYVLKYFNGDIFSHEKIVCSVDVFQICLNIILSGKLPPTIPYDSVLELWAGSFDIAKINFDVPDLVKELVIAQVYRDPSDSSKTFGSVVGKNPKASMYEYEQVTQRQLSAAQSTMNGLIFEDWDMMVSSGIIRTKTNKKENISPMEKVLTF